MTGVIALAVLTAIAIWHYAQPDLPRGISHSLVSPDDTVYAAGFRESRFRQVTMGMSAREVQELIGLPLRIEEFSKGKKIREIDAERATSLTPPPVSANADEVVYLYSRPGARYESYYVRTIVFDRDGRVVGIGADFYND
jgi:hypothetical protein